MNSWLQKLQQKLADIEQGRAEEDFPGHTDEYRRQVIIEAAVSAADQLLMAGSNGSVEETDYLTSAVALKFADKSHGIQQRRLLRADLENRHAPQPTGSTPTPTSGPGET